MKMIRKIQDGGVGFTDWKVIPMTTKCNPNWTLFTLLVLLIIEFPEAFESEVKAELVKPPFDVAPNGKSGSWEDE